MATSPFALFRKNQKALIVVFMVMLMVAFSIGGVVSQMSGSRSIENQVVVSTRFGDLREGDLFARIQRRHLANRFVFGIYQYLLGPNMPANYAHFGPGSEESVVRTMIFAEKARELGVTVSDAQIKGFIDNLSRGRVEGDSLNSILQRMNTSKYAIYDALRTELLAKSLSDLFGSGLQGIPPGERWDYYQRMNRQATVEFVAVPVEEFLDSVADPSDEELQAFFEQYKKEYPQPGSPEPGFHQPHRTAFQYFQADYQTFLDKFAVSDEEIAEYYEQHKDEFPYSGFSAEQDASAVDEPPLDEPAGGVTPAEDEASPAEETPSPEEDAAPSTDGDSSLNEESPLEDEGESEPQSSTRAASPFRRVAFRQPAANEDAPGDDAADDAAATDPRNPTPDAVSDQASDATDAALSSEEIGTNENIASSAGTLADLDAANPLRASDEYVLYRDILSSEDPTNDPLWKVRDTIRRRLASERTGDAMNEVVDALYARMRDYGLARARWQNSREIDAAAVEPAELDFEALAAPLEGVSAHRTKLVSAFELSTLSDLGPSVSNGRVIADLAYGAVGLLRPIKSVDADQNLYLSWKIEDQEDFVPELASVRDEVVRAWKVIHARDAAWARADTLRSEAARGGQSFREYFADKPRREVEEAGPFSWLTAGSAAPTEPMMVAEVSEIEGVVDPGDEFMRGVFSLNEGEVGVAWNQPKTTAYVLRVVRLSPSEAVLRNLFMVDNFSRYVGVARREATEIQRRWIESLESDAELNWLREPSA